MFELWIIYNTGDHNIVLSGHGAPGTGALYTLAGGQALYTETFVDLKTAETHYMSSGGTPAPVAYSSLEAEAKRDTKDPTATSSQHWDNSTMQWVDGRDLAHVQADQIATFQRGTTDDSFSTFPYDSKRWPCDIAAASIITIAYVHALDALRDSYTLNRTIFDTTGAANILNQDELIELGNALDDHMSEAAEGLSLAIDAVNAASTPSAAKAVTRARPS